MLGDEFGAPERTRTGWRGETGAVVQRMQLRRAARHTAKYALDRALGALALIALAPLLVFAAAGLLARTGRILHAQPCAGQAGRVIRLYRFDTASTGDPFATLLHRSGLTDLPLFFNLLRGDLSLVGPRARHPGSDAPRTVLAMRPGILNPPAGGDDPEAAAADLAYVQTFSLAGDMRILRDAVLSGNGGDGDPGTPG